MTTTAAREIKLEDLYIGIGNTVTTESTNLELTGPQGDEEWMVIGSDGIGSTQYELGRTVDSKREETTVGALMIKAVNGEPIKILYTEEKHFQNIARFMRGELDFIEIPSFITFYEEQV